jgi:methyl-accepting chemotaxis protein|nr:MAG TPA: minor tail protein [Bacteriophage sp.]
MGAEIDRLDINIETQSTKAVAALDTLIKKLESVSASVGKINGSNLASFANGIEKICKASSGMSTINANSFKHLADGIKAISGIPTSNMLKTAVNIRVLASGMNKLGAVSQNAKDLGNVANNISKLGGKNIDKAIENMPRISKALNEMMSTLSKAPVVSENLIQMTNAIANLSSQGARAGSISGAVSSDAEKKTSLFSGAFSKLASSIRNSHKGLKSFTELSGSFYANFYPIIRGFKRVWKSVESSMDFLETVNYFEVAMRKLGDDAASNWQQAGYDSAESYANSFSDRAKQLTAKMTGYEIDSDGNATYTGKKNLGMNPNTVMNYQAMFAQVSESIGVAEESALNFSNALTMLGTDWASLRNTTFEQSFEKFASALAGQSRAVRAFGIDITNATLQEYAYKYGLSTAVSEMNQATKAQLRLLAMLDQSKVAFGDMANTMNSPSNQLRMLQQNFANLARTIGNLFLPIVEKVLPYINGLVMALQRLFAWIGSLLGIEFKSINSSMGGADNGMENFVSDTEDAGDALTDADKAAKKLKNTVLGFDELNQLNDNSDSSSGSSKNSGSNAGGGSPILDEAIAKALEEYQKAWDEAFARMDNKAQEVADRICDAFKKGDYKGIGTYISNGITNALESIQWDKVYKVASNFGTGLAQFLNGLITPELFSALGGTIAGSLNTAVYAALSFGETFDWTNLGESIAAGVNRFFKDFDFKALAETLNVWAKGLIDALTTALRKTDWKKIGQSIATFISEIDFLSIAWKLDKLALSLISAIGDTITGFVETAPIESAIVALFMGLKFSGLGGKLGGLIAQRLAEQGITLRKVVIGLGLGLATFKLADSNNKISNLIGAPITAFLASHTMTGKMKLSLKVAAITLAWEGGENLGKLIGEKLFPKDKDYYKDFKWFGDGGFFDTFLSSIEDGSYSEAMALWKQDIDDWWEPWNEKAKEMERKNDEIFGELKSTVETKWNEIVNFWEKKKPLKEIKATCEEFKKKVKKKWSSVTDYWKSKHPLEEIKTTCQNIKEKVREKWNKAIDYWKTKRALSEVKTTYQNIKEKLREKWNTARTWWNDKKPSLKKISAEFPDILGGLREKWTAMKRWWDGLGLKFPSISIGKFHIEYDKDGFASKLWKTFGFDGTPNISFYAGGGFPETGELFMARENGINEMVGKIGNRSTVANNDQIVEAVSAGVADGVMQAMMAVMGGSQQNQAPVIENVFKVDSETLYRMTQKGKEKYDSRYHVVTEF